MTDIKSIKEIEKILGFSINQVVKLDELNKPSDTQNIYSDNPTANYCLDRNENVIGLYIDRYMSY